MKKDKTETRGRPSSITPEIKDKLEYAFANGCSDLEACYYAGVSKTALYEYQKKDLDFAERKKALKARPVLKARLAVMTAISDGDVNTAKWFLERKCKEEFSTRQELTGEDGASLIPVINLIGVDVDGDSEEHRRKDTE